MIPRAAAAIPAALTALCMVAGCSSQVELDGVLWRQMDAVKRSLFHAFQKTLEADRPALLDDIMSDGGAFPGSYLDQDDGEFAASVSSGGVFLSRLVEGADWATLDVLIYSGPRNPASDPLAAAGPGSGPSSAYTCLQAVVEFADSRVSDWVLDEEAGCDPVIVAALPSEAEFVPLHRFDGD